MTSQDYVIILLPVPFCPIVYTERAVLYFRELLFKYNKNKFSFRRVESEKISSHPRRDLL